MESILRNSNKGHYLVMTAAVLGVALPVHADSMTVTTQDVDTTIAKVEALAPLSCPGDTYISVAELKAIINADYPIATPPPSDVPGMVLAFNLASCPTGWSEYTAARGRAIVGAGQGTGLTNRTAGEAGGAETHALTVNELPAHAHSINVYGISGGTKRMKATGNKRFQWGGENTSSAGSGQAHNITQPSLALLYCRKD
jgi:hypothetical protein